jgi:hypothetical protein
MHLAPRRVPQKVAAGLPYQGKDPELFETALKSMNEVLLCGVVGPYTTSCLFTDTTSQYSPCPPWHTLPAASSTRFEATFPGI